MFNRIAGLVDPEQPPLAAAQAAWSKGNQELQASVRRVEDLIRTNPGAALAVAVALGVAVGWWLKRR